MACFSAELILLFVMLEQLYWLISTGVSSSHFCTKCGEIDNLESYSALFSCSVKSTAEWALTNSYHNHYSCNDLSLFIYSVKHLNTLELHFSCSLVWYSVCWNIGHWPQKVPFPSAGKYLDNFTAKHSPCPSDMY